MFSVLLLNNMPRTCLWQCNNAAVAVDIDAVKSRKDRTRTPTPTSDLEADGPLRLPIDTPVVSTPPRTLARASSESDLETSVLGGFAVLGHTYLFSTYSVPCLLARYNCTLCLRMPVPVSFRTPPPCCILDYFARAQHLLVSVFLFLCL